MDADKPKTTSRLGVVKAPLFVLALAGAALAPTMIEKPPSGSDDAVAGAERKGVFGYEPASWREKPGAEEDFLRSLEMLSERPTIQPADGGPFHGGASSALAYYGPNRSLSEGSSVTAPMSPPAPDLAALLGADAPLFQQALAAYRANDFVGGDAAAVRLPPIARTAAVWSGLRLHPREAGFPRLSQFLTEHPDWPAAEWLRKQAEELLLSDRQSDAAISAFFAKSEPSTGVGRLALARVLARAGDFDGAGAQIRAAWRNGDFGEGVETAIRKEFPDFLTVADHKYRTDRLLYADKVGAALRTAQLVGKDEWILARVRAAASADSADDKLFASVPAPLQNDPGLLFARVHMLRKHEKIAEAGALMLKAPSDAEHVIDGDAWWTERRLLARKLLDRGDARTAYQVSAQHLARSTSSKVEAEFHAGWIALRFLEDLPAAERHFAQLAQVAETPLQKSRAAYWRGRTAEARHTPDGDAEARVFYTDAAAHSTTFYGQLAMAKLGSEASPLRPVPEPARGDSRDESVRAVELLLAAGEREPAATLATEAARHLPDEAQVAALGEVVARLREAKFSLTLGKFAAQRGVALDHMAFPDYGVPSFDVLPGSASRSIVYAVARQESAFDPRAISSAGAMGLMQMIASTARATASRVKVGFDLRRMLEEPAFNAQLGAAHLGILLGEHKGSYILTFAAYNAGGGRVQEWINAYGDPRRANVDPIDWIERIPIQETRNYVQRVIENFVVYRAKFGERQTREPQVELARIQYGDRDFTSSSRRQ